MGTFRRRGLGGTDIEPAIDLPRICAYDFCVEFRGQGEGDSRLADSRRADDDEEGIGIFTL